MTICRYAQGISEEAIKQSSSFHHRTIQPFLWCVKTVKAIYVNPDPLYAFIPE